jgi:kynureninase
VIDRAHAERLDAADALARFRDRFVFDDPETIYLDGNSLGRLPVATRERLHALVEQWGSELVSAWHEWIDLPERVGDRLASGVLGARPGEVTVCDSTSVNLFKLASAVLDTRPGAVVTDTGNFPTDRYVLEGVARSHGRELRLFDADPLDGPRPADVEAACAGGDVALVSLSHVVYRSGAVADIEAITRAASAPVLWDLSHSAGVLPIELDRRGIELAVGCTYKYLNAGPGSPAFLYVREELQGGFGPRSRGGSGSASSSRWSGRTTPSPESGAFSRGPRRSSASPPSRRAPGWRARPRFPRFTPRRRR